MIGPDVVEQVEGRLKADVGRAHGAHEAARQQFLRICISPECPSKSEIDNATSTQDLARKALVTALMRFDDFVRHGTIPEDLKSRSKPQTRTAES